MNLPHQDIVIGLDCGKGDCSFISHAHSDHTRGTKNQRNFITSEETFALAGLNGRIVKMKGIKLADAGHILGAKQLVQEKDGEKTVYTGDISIKPNIFGMKADVVECDRLIIESTYLNVLPRLPDPFDVYLKIEKWVKKNERANILIGGYPLGKAQEVIAVLNSYCGIAPIVTEEIEKFTDVYQKFGIKLERIRIKSEEAEELMKRRFVAVVPLKYAKRNFGKRLSEAFGRKTLVSVASGWAGIYRFDVDAAFQLTNHADRHDLISHVEATGAKKVEFFGKCLRRVKLKVKNYKALTDLNPYSRPRWCRVGTMVTWGPVEP